MTPITGPQFSGVFEAISPWDDWGKPAEGEVEDDVEGEQETMVEPDFITSQTDSEEVRMARLKAFLLNASKGVTDGTDEE
jgi:hypothetical protein